MHDRWLQDYRTFLIVHSLGYCCTGFFIIALEMHCRWFKHYRGINDNMSYLSEKSVLFVKKEDKLQSRYSTQSFKFVGDANIRSELFADVLPGMKALWWDWRLPGKHEPYLNRSLHTSKTAFSYSCWRLLLHWADGLLNWTLKFGSRSKVSLMLRGEVNLQSSIFSRSPVLSLMSSSQMLVQKAGPRRGCVEWCQ